MRVYARWRSLEPREQRMAIRAGLELASAIAVLRIAGLRRATRRAAVALRAGKGDREHTVAELIGGVERAGRYLPGATCLAKSLALVRMLREEGVAADLRVGVASASPFEAHAWVESDGIALTASKGMKALAG